MLKEFDLAKAIAGEPVIFRNGDPYKFGAYNPDADEYQRLAGWDNTGDLLTHNDKGQYNCLSKEPNEYDLFMAARQKDLWIAVDDELFNINGAKYYPTSMAYESKEYVLYNFKNHHIIKITIDI